MKEWIGQLLAFRRAHKDNESARAALVPYVREFNAVLESLSASEVNVINNLSTMFSEQPRRALVYMYAAIQEGHAELPDVFMQAFKEDSN